MTATKVPILGTPVAHADRPLYRRSHARVYSDNSGESAMSSAPGWSADEQARRRREKAERLARAAQTWEKGAEGERATASVLAQLPPDEWTVFHDLHWPGRKYANVDHIAVGPGGVFVIDSKNWSGRLTVDSGLRRNGRRHDRELNAVAEAALAVGRMTSLPPQVFSPVVCFIRDEHIAGRPLGVTVCSTGNLLQLLTTRPPTLTAEERQAAALQLDAALRSMTEPASYVDVRLPRPKSPSPALPPRRPRSRRRRPRLAQAVGASLLALIFLAPQSREAVSDWIAKAFDSGIERAAKPRPDAAGQCPASAPIKGFRNSAGRQVYLAPGARRYQNALAEACFASEQAASTAGYRRAAGR